MSVVVNLAEFQKRFDLLNWQRPTVNTDEIFESIKAAPIPGAVILAYLDALVASPSGLNDATIASVTAAQAGQITAFLKAKGALV